MDGEMYLDDDNNSEQNYNPQGIFFTEVNIFLGGNNFAHL